MKNKLLAAFMLSVLLCTGHVHAQDGHFFGGQFGDAPEKGEDQETTDGRVLVNTFEITDTDLSGAVELDEYENYLIAGYHSMAGRAAELSWLRMQDLVEISRARGVPFSVDQYIRLRLMFSMGDRNSDDQLSYSELTASTPFFFDDLDSNKDRRLAMAEYENEGLRLILPLMAEPEIAEQYFSGGV